VSLLPCCRTDSHATAGAIKGLPWAIVGNDLKQLKCRVANAENTSRETRQAQPEAQLAFARLGVRMKADDDVALNILGGPLQVCGLDPKTGYFRDGHCRTRADDSGLHVVCAQVDDPFLAYSHGRGNDLITPQPAYGFPGLKAGDRWCLCATRWLEALDAGVAPKVFAQATHARALDVIELDQLLLHALDLPQNG